ncbi:MAG TPA: hypothetical protein VKC89_02230 [Patescibacteria group bacterium]|nr:hypothetical protein [Patescibacteria group bacterium]
MGKIKVRTLGTEDEQLQKNEQKKKSEDKKLAKVQGSGGQRIPAVGPTEEELDKLDEQKLVPAEEVKEEPKKTKKEKFQKEKRARSKKYQAYAQMIDNKSLPVSEALELLEKMQRKTFDETVELHINASDSKISASTTLPHGTGKALRVAITTDELIAEVETGKVNFDILLATPAMMPKLAKVAKTLGPKGLMPNPKNGTITNDPEEAAKKYEGGLTFIKTEAKAPLIHIAVGKVSFGPKKLEENIAAVLSAVKKENISQATLKSTMSPGIKLQI